MTDQEKIEAMGQLAHATVRAVHKDGAVKSLNLEVTRATKIVLTALLGRKPTAEEIDKAEGE